jgi:hypothetical protein
LSNKVESKTEIKLDVQMDDKQKVKCANEMVAALDEIDSAEEDMKDYIKEQKEKIEEQQAIIDQAKQSIRSASHPISDGSKMLYTQSILSAMNAISEIEGDLHSFTTAKKAEIAKYQAIVELCKIKLNRGKDSIWAEVKMIKDYDAKTKTYVNKDTGEVIKTVPMTEDDLQMVMEEEQSLEEEGIHVKRVK